MPILAGAFLLHLSGCQSGSGGPDMEAADLRAQPMKLPEVLIPAGSFLMGASPAEGGNQDQLPQHMVTLGAFYLETTEVPVTAYKQCMDAGACTPPQTGDPYCTYGRPGLETHPITCIDWSQASAYCAFAKKRLPTEEEWEYAARGPAGSLYPWGNDPPTAPLCWSGDQTQVGTCAVGTSTKALLGAPNAQGLSDLAGNVWEWTSTAYVPYPDKTPCTKDSAVCVVRGGSWSTDMLSTLHTAYRYNISPQNFDDDYGVRCARDP